MNGIIGRYHVSKNISPTKDFTNTTTDTKSTLSVVVRLYNGATSLGEKAYDITETGLQTINSVVVTSTPITRIYIKHNGSRVDIPILDINVDFPNGQFWFTADFNSINPTVSGGIQLSNMMLNRGSSALPYEPYDTEVWHDIPYTRLETATDTITALPKTTYNDGTSATVAIKGNMQQSGTPTPTTPITPQECGERTKNLFDFLSWTNSIISIYGNGSFTTTEDSISITSGTSTDAYTQPYGAATSYRISVKPNTTYTCKIGGSGSYQLIIFENGNASSGYVHYYDVGTRMASFTTKSNTTFVSFRAANTGSLGSTATLSQVMFAEGEYTAQTMPPYEPYGYKIPVISGNTTTNIYLKEPLRKINIYYDQLTYTGLLLRGIKKLVLTGEENFDYYSVAQGSLFRMTLNNSPVKSQLSEMAMCSHYNVVIATNRTNMTLSGILTAGSNVTTMDFINNDYNNATEFKAHLAAQYAAGTPVTVWYVLATPTTETVTMPTIPTTSGGQTFDVGTTLKPSEVDLTYHGWHEHEAEKLTSP